MKEKRAHAESRFFSAAFGVIIIAVGLTWFLQTIGVLPQGIKVLEYACSICVILIGARMLVAHAAQENKIKQKIMEDNNVKM